MRPFRTFSAGLAALIAVFTLLFLSVHTVQALIGDLDFSGLVDLKDLTLVDRAYGSRGESPNWDARADLNGDQGVDLRDLTLAGRNFGSLFNFYLPRRISNGQAGNVAFSQPVWVESGTDGAGRVHVIWIDAAASPHQLFYTRLDSSGMPLTEDVLLADDVDEARLAMDDTGQVHLVWRQGGDRAGLYYARLDGLGRWLNPPVLVCHECAHPALAVDANKHAHLLYQQSGFQIIYAVLGTDGLPLLPAARMNPAFTNPLWAADGTALAVDAAGNRHLLWRQPSGVVGSDLLYTRIAADGTVLIDAKPSAHLTAELPVPRHFTVRVDSQGAVQLVYADDRGTPGSIFWRRIESAGTLGEEKVVSTLGSAGVPDVLAVLDSSDRLHLLAAASNPAGEELGYAQLDRAGLLLTPFQRVLYHARPVFTLTVDVSGRAVLLSAASQTDSTGAKPLFVVTSLADSGAIQSNRADLVVDDAHLDLSSTFLKTTSNADITLTLTNAGWVRASGNFLAFTYLDEDGLPQRLEARVPDLEPYQSAQVHRQIPAPMFAAAGSWDVKVTAYSATIESTLSNNQVIARFGVTPPPQFFNLEVMAYDETYAPLDRAAAANFPAAELTLENVNLGFSQTLAPAQTDAVFWQVPLDLSPANGPLYPTIYNLTLRAPGYAEVSRTVTARRASAGDPFTIVVDPPMPVKIYTQMWGTIQGKVTTGGALPEEVVPLENVMVTLDDTQTVLTGADGAYLFEKVPVGSHRIDMQASGKNAVRRNAVEVLQGQSALLDVSLTTATSAVVTGRVVNLLGLPVEGATVNLLADPDYLHSALTLADGRFEVSVDLTAGYSNYRLEAEAGSVYLPFSQPLDGLETGGLFRVDISMLYAPGISGLMTDGVFTSWQQVQAWCKPERGGLAWSQALLITFPVAGCPTTEVRANWGGFVFWGGLEAQDDAGISTAQSLVLRFNPQPFMSYPDTLAGPSGGGETQALTALRVDWVEWVTLDSSGSPVGDPLWKDENIWYTSEAPDPAAAERKLVINTPVADWANTGLRIFYTVGVNDAAAPHGWKKWVPDADPALEGSGRPAGADRQMLIWRLNGTALEQRYSLVDYRSTAGVLNRGELQREVRAILPEQVGIVQMAFSLNPPAQVGAPYVIDLTVTGMEDRPVYGIEFSLAYDPHVLRLANVVGGADFGGSSGTYLREVDYSATQAAGKLSSAVAVRLGAAQGLTEGDVVRLVFVPLQKAEITELDLHSVKLTGLDGEFFTPGLVLDGSFPITDGQLFLPFVQK